MNTRQQVRMLEEYLSALTGNKKEKIAIISKAQSLINPNSQQFNILSIAKRRLIRSL